VKHLCHAIGCNVEVAPRLLMCPRHWAMVPGLMKAAIYAEYRCGQEQDKRPTRAYVKAARAAINRVREIEEARRAEEMEP
jgi:hypothetical protein